MFWGTYPFEVFKYRIPHPDSYDLFGSKKAKQEHPKLLNLNPPPKKEKSQRLPIFSKKNLLYDGKKTLPRESQKHRNCFFSRSDFRNCCKASKANSAAMLASAHSQAASNASPALWRSLEDWNASGFCHRCRLE